MIAAHTYYGYLSCEMDGRDDVEPVEGPNGFHPPGMVDAVPVLGWTQHGWHLAGWARPGEQLAGYRLHADGVYRPTEY